MATRTAPRIGAPERSSRSERKGSPWGAKKWGINGTSSLVHVYKCIWICNQRRSSFWWCSSFWSASKLPACWIVKPERNHKDMFNPFLWSSGFALQELSQRNEWPDEKSTLEKSIQAKHEPIRTFDAQAATSKNCSIYIFPRWNLECRLLSKR